MKVYVIEGNDIDNYPENSNYVVSLFLDQVKALNRVKELENEYPLENFYCTEFEVIE